MIIASLEWFTGDTEGARSRIDTGLAGHPLTRDVVLRLLRHSFVYDDEGRRRPLAAILAPEGTSPL